MGRSLTQSEDQEMSDGDATAGETTASGPAASRGSVPLDLRRTTFFTDGNEEDCLGPEHQLQPMFSRSSSEDEAAQQLEQHSRKDPPEILL